MAACPDPCTLEALAKRVAELEEAVRHPGLWGWLRYLVENAAGLLLLLVGLVLLGLLLWWLGTGGATALRRLHLKSASVSATGASIDFDTLAQQTNAMMEAVQGHVIQEAAISNLRALADGFMAAGKPADAALLKALNPADPPAQTSFSDKPAARRYAPLSILWVLPDPDSRAFERQVVAAMGNRIEVLVGADAGRARLVSGAAYDLVIIEDTAPGAFDQPAGLELALDLLSDVRSAPGVGAPQRIEVGRAMRLALLTAAPLAGDREAQLERKLTALGGQRSATLRPHVLFTADFYTLRRSIRWMQKEKTPPEPKDA